MADTGPLGADHVQEFRKFRSQPLHGNLPSSTPRLFDALLQQEGSARVHRRHLAGIADDAGDIRPAKHSALLLQLRKMRQNPLPPTVNHVFPNHKRGLRLHVRTPCAQHRLGRAASPLDPAAARYFTPCP